VPIERAPPSEIAIPGARAGSPAARAVAAYLARLAPNRRRAVLGRLRAVGTVVAGPRDGVAWHALGHAQLAQLRDQLQANGMSPPMINLTLIVLRGMAAAAADIGLVSQGAAGELKLVRGLSIPHDRPAPGRVVKPSDVAALVSVCRQDRSIAGVRDLAIIHGFLGGYFHCRTCPSPGGGFHRASSGALDRACSFSSTPASTPRSRDRRRLRAVAWNTSPSSKWTLPPAESNGVDG